MIIQLKAIELKDAGKVGNKMEKPYNPAPNDFNDRTSDPGSRNGADSPALFGTSPWKHSLFAKTLGWFAH